MRSAEVLSEGVRDNDLRSVGVGGLMLLNQFHILFPLGVYFVFLTFLFTVFQQLVKILDFLGIFNCFYWLCQLFRILCNTVMVSA